MWEIYKREDEKCTGQERIELVSGVAILKLEGKEPIVLFYLMHFFTYTNIVLYNLDAL